MAGAAAEEALAFARASLFLALIFRERTNANQLAFSAFYGSISSRLRRLVCSIIFWNWLGLSGIKQRLIGVIRLSCRFPRWEGLDSPYESVLRPDGN